MAFKMKRFQLFVFCLSLLSFTAYSQQPLIFAQINDTPDQVIGAEILKVAYQRLGIPIDILSVPGKRALIESSNGRLAGEVHRIYRVGEDYPTLVRVPTSINYIEPSVFSNNKVFSVTGCKALKDYIIGRTRGVRHAEVCTQGMAHIKVYNDSRVLMENLKLNRVELAITAKINGIIQLTKLGQHSISVLTPPLKKMPVYHYLHDQHKDLIPKIDKIFRSMLEAGELESIRNRVIAAMLKKARQE